MEAIILMFATETAIVLWFVRRAIGFAEVGDRFSWGGRDAIALWVIKRVIAFVLLKWAIAFCWGGRDAISLFF